MSGVQRSIPGFDKGEAWYRCSEGTSIGPVPGALSRRWRAVLRRRRRTSKSEGAARIVVIPAVEVGLQRWTLIMQPAAEIISAIQKSTILLRPIDDNEGYITA